MKSFVSPDNLKRILQSFKANINGIIGTTTLVTTNKTLTGAINELNDAITKTANSLYPKKLKNSVTLTANTTEITTGVNYDPTKNIMMVFVNGLYIEEGEEYNVTSNNTKITLTTQLTASSSSPVIVRFVVIKL